MTLIARTAAAFQAGSIRAVLFDKDGTLLDYQASWAPANVRAAEVVARGDCRLAHHLLREGGQDPESGHIVPGSPLAAASNREIAEHWLGHVDDWDIDSLAAAIEEVFQRAAAVSAVALPGVADALERMLARSLRLGVATNDSAAGAAASLRCIGLDGYFEFVAGWDSGHGAKPGPGMVRAFCEAIGMDPAAVAVVGDNVHDLEMGRAAGAGALIGVLSGTGTHEVLAPLSDAVISGVPALPDLLAP